MAKEKVTITLDRAKADEARVLANTRSVSETIDAALDQFIRTARLRNDIAAYRGTAPTDVEVALASHGSVAGLDDETDWEGLYADDRT